MNNSNNNKDDTVLKQFKDAFLLDKINNKDITLTQFLQSQLQALKELSLEQLNSSSVDESVQLLNYWFDSFLNLLQQPLPVQAPKSKSFLMYDAQLEKIAIL